MSIREIQEHDNMGGFSCGVAALDVYLQRHAYVNHVVGISRCFVLPHADPGRGILGFYTLSAKSVDVGTVGPHVAATRLPRYPLGVIYIGSFAVEQQSQGQGYGRQLIGHALRTAGGLMSELGAVGVYLEAHDERARAFYLQHGFIDLVPDGEAPYPMFLPRGTLQAALSGKAP
ncbi:MAG: GNAT family N-acetyltransferase [Gemmatimonadota bacterium]